MKLARASVLLPLLAATWFLAPVARAEDDASRVLVKMRQLDLLNQMLPVLMTKEQVQKLLGPVEKARNAEKAIQKTELEQLKKIEAKLDAAIKDAKENQRIPPTELQTEVFKTLTGFQKARAEMIIEQNEAVLKAVEETLDEGQIKAASNALSLPTKDGETLTSRDKLRRWVRGVLMDPLSYDLLVELSRKKSG